MRLFIAEKPDMGRKIAAALPGPHQRKDGYMETGGGLVTWCIGHLLEQVAPDGYDPKYGQFPWKFEDLPIVPAQWRVEPVADKKKQVNTIKALLKQCDEVVNAGDPGREGQLIVDEVLEFLNNKKPVRRLLLPSLDAPTVRKAIGTMDDNQKFFALYQAALCRQRADWLVGMNGTRSYTILGKKQGYPGVLSVGRVQTPTLAIVVKRDEEIEAFKPSAYWSIHAACKAASSPDPFWTVWVPPGRDAGAALQGEAEVDKLDDEEEGDEAAAEATASAEAAALAARPAWLDDKWRIIDENEAKRIASAIRTAAKANVVRDERKSAEEPPPLLFELTSLTARINAKTGASADDVLKACQSLYEAGHASYPRSDCQYLPTAIFGEAPQVLAAIGQSVSDLTALAQGATPTLQSRAWNDAKVGEHYGIIPTGSPPNYAALSPLEQAVYEAIARRYLAQFYPACKVDKAFIELESAGERLVARGRVVVDPGWRVVFSGTQEDDASSKAAPTLPSLAVGQTVDVPEVRLDAHTTKPPPRFTEGTLILAMKHVYRLVSDPVARKKLKAVEGIGRSATRASIIKNLIKRTFLVTEKKKIVSSPAARVLVHALPAKLADPALTATWENALDMVAQGKATLDAFMAAQVKWVQQIVAGAQGATLPALPSSLAGATASSRASSGSGTRAKPSSAGRSAAGKGGKSGGKAAGPSDKKCPKCGSAMQERTVRQGPKAGQTFFGCTGYPKCTHSEWPK